MVKSGMVAVMQKLEAQSWVAQEEWSQLYGIYMVIPYHARRRQYAGM